MRVERGYWDVITTSMEKKRGTTFEKELSRQLESEEDKKEAITKALWFILAGNDNEMDTKEIEDLYETWGMPDAQSAAKATFKRVDKDGSNSIDYDEFKTGFKVLIDGIFLIGEYEDKYWERQHLEENEMGESKKREAKNQAVYPFCTK